MRARSVGFSAQFTVKIYLLSPALSRVDGYLSMKELSPEPCNKALFVNKMHQMRGREGMNIRRLIQTAS